MSTSLYFCIRPCAMWKRSRNSHFLSQQLDRDPSGDLNLPPPKKKMPKHKRKFTKTIDKRAKKAVPATMAPLLTPKYLLQLNPLHLPLFKELSQPVEQNGRCLSLSLNLT